MIIFFAEKKQKLSKVFKKKTDPLLTIFQQNIAAAVLKQQKDNFTKLVGGLWRLPSGFSNLTSK